MNSIHTSLFVASRLPYSNECDQHFGAGPLLRLFMCDGLNVQNILTLGAVYRHHTGNGNVRTYLIDGNRSQQEVREMVISAITKSACVVAMAERDDFDIAPYVRSLLEAGIQVWIGLGENRSARALEEISDIYDKLCNCSDTQLFDDGICNFRYAAAEAHASSHAGGRVISGILHH